MEEPMSSDTRMFPVEKRPRTDVFIVPKRKGICAGKVYSTYMHGLRFNDGNPLELLFGGRLSGKTYVAYFSSRRWICLL